MPGSIFEFKPDAKETRMLERLRAGEEEALADLYETNRRVVVAHVLRNGGGEADAEDLLQDAVIVLWERIRSGTFEQSAKLSTFLFSIVKHNWSRRTAQKRRNVPRSEAEWDVPDGDPIADELMIEDEESSAISTAMNTLGDPCRRLLILFYWEERSTEEIAKLMGFANADTVKSKKYQCKKSLEKLLRGMM